MIPGKRKLRNFVICILLVVFPFVWQGISAQGVALVLSGGGPKGLAHIGVIKALEENQIPIDYIAGTSMGAIIGGLYACGYTPEQIKAYVLSDEIEKWAMGQPDPELVYFFKSPDPNASWISLNFDYNEASKRMESRLPTNLISPNQLDFGILQLYSPASAAACYDFDSLFVPFRCVASDIDSNKSVIFHDGQLGHAVRASMTYPFYVKPIEIDGKVLFDGGLYNNFPVDVALAEFNPGFVIGSKTTANFPSAKKDDIKSQIQNMMTRETNYFVPEGKGIMIEPALPNLSVVDFSRNAEIIDSGYVAAMRKMPEILKNIEARVSQATLNERRNQFLSKLPEIIVDSISVTGLNKNQAKYVENIFHNKSSYLTLKAIKADYFRLLSDQNVKYVFPSLIYRPDCKFYELQLKVTRAEHFTAEFGGNIASNSSSTAFLGIQYNLLNRFGYNFLGNGYFGRFYSSGNLEFRVDFPGNIPVFLKADFTYNHKDYFKNSTYFFEDTEPSFLISNESHFNVQGGIPVSNSGIFSLNAAVGFTKDQYYQTNQFARSDTADVTNFNFFTPGASFELNTMNNKQYPNDGWHILFGVKYIYGREKSMPGSTSVNNGQDTIIFHNWIQLKALYNNYFHMNRWFKLGLYGKLLLSSQGLFSNYTATILRTPAFEPLPEMKTIFLPKYRALNYAAIGLQPVFKVYRNFDLRLEGYIFQPFEELSQDENQVPVEGTFLSERSYVWSAALVYHLRLTPISLSFNYYDKADDKFSVIFNIGFILFNKSVID